MTTRPSEALTPLTELHLTHQHDLSALRELADLSQLTTLTLDQCPLGDLGPLVSLHALTSLELYGCPQVQDLSPLADRCCHRIWWIIQSGSGDHFLGEVFLV